MTDAGPQTAWIFVSHASHDIQAVRKIRNYLEDKGAAPLLFHLMALQEPTEFWPIIEREIEARNFFLYCESQAAEASTWVRKERDAVVQAQRRGPKRIGRVLIDGDKFEPARLDDLLAKTRVFPSFLEEDRSRVRPFLDALNAAGFAVFDATAGARKNWLFEKTIAREIRETSKSGWIVLFMSRQANRSPWIVREMETAIASRGALVLVLLEPLEAPVPLSENVFLDGYTDSGAAPARLATLLLTRP